MRKFILTESEKKEIKSLYRSKGLVLLEQEGEYEQDAPNWDKAKEWAMSKPGAKEGQRDGGINTMGKPFKGISYVSWTEANSKKDGDYVVLYNYGKGKEVKDGKLVRDDPESVLSGDWEWNGNEVIFSWRTNDSSQEGEYKQDAPNWDKAKEWAMSKPGAEEFQKDGGISASTGKPFKGYSGAKWLEGDSSFTIFNYGVARELNEKNGKIVNPLPTNYLLSGNWEWNGNEVIFSWKTNDNSDSSSSTTTDTSNCESLFAEAEKEKTYNPANLKAGKVVIGKGNQGALVKAMQCYLNQKNEELSLGLTPLKVDSIFGNKTKEMTIKFQEQFPNELKADGIIGKNTYAKFGIAD